MSKQKIARTNPKTKRRAPAPESDLRSLEALSHSIEVESARARLAVSRLLDAQGPEARLNRAIGHGPDPKTDLATIAAALRVIESAAILVRCVEVKP